MREFCRTFCIPLSMVKETVSASDLHIWVLGLGGERQPRDWAVDLHAIDDGRGLLIPILNIVQVSTEAKGYVLRRSITEIAFEGRKLR